MDANLGSVLRGPQITTEIAMMLYGITTLQTLKYFYNYPKDRWALKLMVVIVWTLETIHSAGACSAMDFYAIANYNNPSVLASSHWQVSMTLIIAFNVTLVINMFYAWRIWMFSRSLYMPIALAALEVVRYCTSMATSVYSITHRNLSNFETISNISIIVSITLAMLVDSLAAITLAYYLHKGRSGIQRTRIDRLINRLIVYAFIVGAITTMLSVAGVIVYFVLSNSFDYYGTVLVQTKLYSNTFLMWLNIRHSQARTLDDPLSTNKFALGSALVFGAGGMEVESQLVRNTGLQITESDVSPC